MKKYNYLKVVILIIFTNITLTSFAQDYTIDFVATGESSNIDSIRVKNFTTDEIITIMGNESLHLTDDPEGIADKEFSANLSLYPNPISDKAFLLIESFCKDDVSISISDINGKIHLNQTVSLLPGEYAFKVSGLSSGQYIISLIGEKIKTEEKLIVSTKTQVNKPSIELISQALLNNTKSTKTENIVDMLYHNGDWVMFIAYADGLCTTTSIQATESQTVSIQFASCVDFDGNSYNAVQIGEQLWMATDLQTTHYSDGEPIPNINSYPDSDAGAISAAMKISGTDNFQYNYSATMRYGHLSSYDIQGTCPDGWHIPTHTDPFSGWLLLFNEYESYQLAGDSSAWGNCAITNNSNFGVLGFNALPKENWFEENSVLYSAHCWNQTVSASSVYTTTAFISGSYPETTIGGYQNINKFFNTRCIHGNNYPETYSIAKIQMSNDTIFSGDSIAFVDSSTNNPDYVYWSILSPDQFEIPLDEISTDSVINLTLTETGNYTIVLKASKNSTSSFDIKKLVVLP